MPISSWDEINEISLVVPGPQPDPDPLTRFGTTPVGQTMRIAALMADIGHPFPALTSAPGASRVRAHARGRDHNVDGVDYEPVEEYLEITWPAPPGPGVVHKGTDWFGADMRGSGGGAATR